MVTFRLPRFFEKKRGSRRTGSQAWGRFGEACFYTTLLAAGVVFAVMLGQRVVEAPGIASIGLWMWLLTLLLPGALLVIGGSGLARLIRSWGRSEERLAATRRLPDLLDRAANGPLEAEAYPTVPGWDNLNNSPGTILRYRLPLESPESWTVFGFGLFAVLWNAVVVILGVTAGVDMMGGQTDWLLLSILLAFAGIGVAVVAIFVRALILQTAVGPTQIEIGDHPLRPGVQADLFIGQGGAGMFRRLAISLELEELASFHQGTDSRTERRVVVSVPITEWRSVAIAPGRRFEARATLRIPADAMHSFVSPHNAVSWRIAVLGEPARWPRFTRRFPIVVLPQRAHVPFLEPPPVNLSVARTAR